MEAQGNSSEETLEVEWEKRTEQVEEEKTEGSFLDRMGEKRKGERVLKDCAAMDEWKSSLEMR